MAMRRCGSLRRRYGRSGFRIGTKGLEKTASFRVVPGHVYAMGASSSPSLIEVISVTDDRIQYKKKSGDQSPKVIERWIGEDLISRGEKTFNERYGVSAQRWTAMSDEERGAQWERMRKR